MVGMVKPHPLSRWGCGDAEAVAVGSIQCAPPRIGAFEGVPQRALGRDVRGVVDDRQDEFF